MNLQRYDNEIQSTKEMALLAKMSMETAQKFGAKGEDDYYRNLYIYRDSLMHLDDLEDHRHRLITEWVQAELNKLKRG